MISGFKALLRHLAGIADALYGLQERLGALPLGSGEDSGLAARLDALERSRALWEAEMEAQLSRSDEAFKRARAAEERARYHAARSGDEAEDGDEEGVEALQDAWNAFLQQYAGGGPENGLSPVHQDLGADREGPLPYYQRIKAR